MHNSQVFPTLQWPGRRARRGTVPSNTCVRVAYVWNCLEYMCTCHLFPLGPIEGLKGHEQLGEAPEGLRPVLPEQKGGCTQCVWGLSEIPFFTIRVWSLPVFCTACFCLQWFYWNVRVGASLFANAMPRRRCALYNCTFYFRFISFT